MDVSFQLLWINTKKHGCWLYDKYLLSFGKKKKKRPNWLPKWLNHFVFPLAVNEGSHCDTSSPALGGVSVQDILGISI